MVRHVWIHRLAAALLVLSGLDGPRPADAQGAPDTHGKDATPDYARVFPQDRVTRLDVRVAAADWQALMDDMASMAGSFGAGGTGGGGGMPPGGGGPGGGGGGASSEAIAACSGKVEGASCSFAGTAGRCARQTGAQPVLACVALGGGGGGGNPGGGRDDVELLPRTPIYVPATVTYDGETFESVGLRLKGNSSLLNSWRSGVLKLPLRLNFDEFEASNPAVKDQTFFGFQNLNLTNNASDASFLRAKVGHDLFRDADVPSSMTAFTRLYLDRGTGPEYFGLYTVVEVPGRAMLDREFDGHDGNLYKPNGTGARWTTFLEDSFPKKTNENEADWSDIQEGITALNASRTNAASWRSRLEAAFNVDGFLKWLALNTIIGNFDTYGGLAPHNYYLYGDPLQRDRLQWIPWDLDLAFGGMGATTVDLFHDSTASTWPLIRYLMDDSTYKARYREHVTQLLESVFHTGSLTARLRDARALIEPDVIGPDGEQAGRTFIESDDEFTRAVNTLVSYVETRAQQVRSALSR